MITIQDYVNGLFKDIPDSTEKENIIQEIILNLEEKVQDLMEQGKSEEDAINKSIVEFGDADELKSSLKGLPDNDGVREKKKASYGNLLFFSVCGSSLLIALFLFINFYYTPKIIWFVYPVFAILWWPLSMLFVWLTNRKK